MSESMLSIIQDVWSTQLCLHSSVRASLLVSRRPRNGLNLVDDRRQKKLETADCTLAEVRRTAADATAVGPASMLRRSLLEQVDVSVASEVRRIQRRLQLAAHHHYCYCQYS